MNTSERLKKIRKEERKSQQEMADKLNISLRAYQNYEQGKRMPASSLLELYARMNYNIHWIITGNSPMRPGDQLEENETIKDLKMWLQELEQEDPEAKDWFSFEIKRKLPEFREWIKKREDNKNIFPKENVA